LNNLVLQKAVLCLQLFLQCFDLFERQRVRHGDRDDLRHILQQLHFVAVEVAFLKRNEIDGSEQFAALE
jgi:hypothetical protein